VGREVVGGGEQSGVCLCIVFTEHYEALLYYALRVWLWRFWSLSWFNWIKMAGCVYVARVLVCVCVEAVKADQDEYWSQTNASLPKVALLWTYTHTQAQKVKKSCWSYLGEVITLSYCPCQIPHIHLSISRASDPLCPDHLRFHLHLIYREQHANQNELATWKCQCMVIWLYEAVL